MQIRPYTDADCSRWDEFCNDSYMATFLHSRRFLLYHGQRFCDLSLILEDDNGQWLGLFPAALHPDQPDTVVSHPGITYGGVLHRGMLCGEDMIEALQTICNHYAETGFSRLIYKAIPNIYQQAPAQDDLYALFRLRAQRTRCDLSCAIDFGHRLKVSERRRRSYKKALRSDPEITSGIENASPFWDILKDNLLRRHGAQPVHRLDEIQWLAERFPQEIRFLVARVDGRVEAGVVMFLTPMVHHMQYIAASELGYQYCLLDAVFADCIENARNVSRYLNFGISTENQGLELNQGLYDFKSEFGAGSVVHEFYEIELRT